MRNEMKCGLVEMMPSRVFMICLMIIDGVDAVLCNDIWIVVSPILIILPYKVHASKRTVKPSINKTICKMYVNFSF